MDCKIFYRISSESQKKEKLPGATKERCLENFVQVFGDRMYVIADNCHEPLLRHMESLGLRPFETNLGNSGSFRHALNLAVRFTPETLIYFVEDDYLHLPPAPKLLTEAIEYADYVTVYDHPDKYGPYYDGGEVSKVFRTAGSHWRFTSSTTMTFAAQVKTLRDDYDFWLKCTEGEIPQDALTFAKLGEKEKTVAVSVPGAACHIDLEYSGMVGYNTLEDWTVGVIMGMVLKGMSDKVRGEATSLVAQMRKQGMAPLQQIACLVQLDKTTKAE